MVVVLPSGRTQVVHDGNNFALGALAARTAVVNATKVDASRRQGMQLSKLKIFFQATSKTANDGPILIGLAKDLGAAEIAEALEADPQYHEDPGAAERANRQLFPTEVIPSDCTSYNGAVNWDSTSSRLRNIGFPSWEIEEGAALFIFAFNQHSGQALTTGTILHWTMVTVGRWLDD